MRMSTPFEGLSLLLMILATFYAIVGHCNSDKKTLVACALYTLAGLCLAGGLLVFASVLSDAFFGHPHLSPTFPKQISSSHLNTQNGSPLTVDYKYGWSFFAAGASFIMAEIAAVFTISAYIRRYRSVEEMVSMMVPGARRKLCEINMNYAKKKTENAGNQTKIEQVAAFVESKQPPEDVNFGSKAPPDICSANITSVLGDRSSLEGREERNLLLEPHECDKSPKLIAENVEFHIEGGSELRASKIGDDEELDSLSKLRNENCTSKSKCGMDSDGEFVGITVPIKVKTPGRNHSTLNTRNIQALNRSTFQNNVHKSVCKGDLLPQCNVKCCVNLTTTHNRYTNTNSLCRQRLNQAQAYSECPKLNQSYAPTQDQAPSERRALEIGIQSFTDQGSQAFPLHQCHAHPFQGLTSNHGYLHGHQGLELESPSSSGFSISGGPSCPPSLTGNPDRSQHCDCKDFRFRSLPRRKIVQGGYHNSSHPLALECAKDLPRLPESALARDL